MVPCLLCVVYEYGMDGLVLDLNMLQCTWYSACGLCSVHVCMMVDTVYCIEYVWCVLCAVEGMCMC